MKIAFILILHLGLVACAQSPQDFKALQCQAISELGDYFFDGKDPKGDKISGMLDKYVGQGLITKVASDAFKKEIPVLAKDRMIVSLAVKIENFIRSKTCFCSGNVGKNDTVDFAGSNAGVGITGSNITFDITGLNAKAEVVKLDTKTRTIRLDVKAGSIKLKATAEKACLIFACSTCRAVDQLLKYLTDNTVDPMGATFWGYLTEFTSTGLMEPCELERFRRTLRYNKVELLRDKHFRNASFEVIRFLQGKSQANCCGNVGSNATAGNAAEFKCELGTSKEKAAIQKLKEFIKKNDHSSVEIVSMVNNFYVRGSIPGFEWEEYRKLERGELNGKPRELAERVLEDVLRNYGLNQLNYYMNKVVHHDDKGIKLLELLKELQNEGLMTESNYKHCQELYSGPYNEMPLSLASFVKEDLMDGEHSQICERRI